MKDQINLFLSSSDNEKYKLFVAIKRARFAQASAADLITAAKNHTDLVTEVNLKQIASITHKSYSSVYNTYNGLVPVLEEMLGRRNPAIKRMFAIEEDALFFHLVEQSHPYLFIMAMLEERVSSFEQFWQDEESSKATMLRHIKPMRDFAKQFDVSFSYEPMRLVGEERNVRMFLTVVLWLATNGDVYPFSYPGEPDVRVAFDEALSAFDLPIPNPVTVRIGVFYMTVALKRVLSGHILNSSSQSPFLHYPTPNLFKVLKEKRFNLIGLDGMNLDEQMAETANLYFLFNFAPIHIISGADNIAATIDRYRKYNPNIYKLVNGFFDKLPIDFAHDLNMSPAEVDMLKANLLVVSLSTLVMGKDYTQVIEQNLNLRLRATPANPVLLEQVKQTLAYVVFTEKLDALEPYLPMLEKSYYNNANQLLHQQAPTNRIKVAPLIEQTVVGYIDLLVFLGSLPFVELMAPTTNLDDADFLITSAYGSATEYQGSDAVQFPWRIDYATDQFGQLYSVLREMWEQRS